MSYVDRLALRMLKSRPVVLLTEVDVRELLVLARARLARWIAPKRKPPVQLIETVAPDGVEIPSALRPTRPVTLPSPEVLDQMRGEMEFRDWTSVEICRGSKKGCDGSNQRECRYCYSVRWYDKRPSDEILQAIERGDA